jgi:hypothetical protein
MCFAYGIAILLCGLGHAIGLDGFKDGGNRVNTDYHDFGITGSTGVLIHVIKGVHRT